MTPSSVLRHPAVYVLFQRAVGAHLARAACVEVLAPVAGERIVDVGCGPAYYLGDLPDVDYHGFDTDEVYIQSARERWGRKGAFYCEPYAEKHRQLLAPVDGVMLMGLLHHLEDEDADAVLGLVARSLKPQGRAISLDTVLFEGQSAVSRALAKNDRGDFVRTPKGFERLARPHFADIQTDVIGDTLRMPSAHFRMVLKRPRE